MAVKLGMAALSGVAAAAHGRAASVVRLRRLGWLDGALAVGVLLVGVQLSSAHA